MKIRKAVLTGGGRATRLYPITTTTNKHLLPLANKPMIFHAIETVVAAGITEIFINTNPGETELQKHIGDGGHWGVSVKFFEQSGGPQGIAHAVNEARQLIGDDPFLFYLSDNIFLGGVNEMVADFEHGGYDCMLALATVPDPGRFGVPIFDAEKKLIEVREKPQNPPNNFAVTGIYVYGPKIFFEAFQKLQKSARGEYEISDIHTQFLRSGKTVGVKEISGYWKDTGKPEDLLTANRLLLEHADAGTFTHPERITIGTGTIVGEDVTIVGPAVIGENCVLDHSKIGPYASIGVGSTVSGGRVENSILLNAVTLRGCAVVDSLIGRHATIVKRGGSTGGEPMRMVLGDNTVIEI